MRVDQEVCGVLRGLEVDGSISDYNDGLKRRRCPIDSGSRFPSPPSMDTCESIDTIYIPISHCSGR